jgi:rod shape-determining protein MreB
MGIDLGTCNSAVFLPKKGIVLEEPSVVAVDLVENKVLAVGKEAKEMLGRTPPTIKIYRPLKDGVIADFKITQAMIRYFIKKTLGFHIFKPELVIGIPVGATSTERRAVVEAGILAGAKNVYLVKEPILAALGAQVPIESCHGNLIVDIGGGTTEIAVISLGGIVTAKSIRVGGDEIDLAIVNLMKEKYNLVVGESLAEEIKIKIGTAIPEKEKKEMVVKGRHWVSGLPKTIKVSSNDVCQAISGVLEEIVQAIKEVLRNTPPELVADIAEKGMVLTGGGALLRNLPKLFSKEIGIPTILAKDPIFAVARGTGVILENLIFYKKAIEAKKI